MPKIATNIAQILHNIETAARQSGRNPSDIELLAVTKAVDIAATEAVLATGVLALGENRLPALQAKYEAIGARAKWHFIGKIQSRKARDVVAIADLIHSVDSLKLASEISKRATAIGQECSILLELNSGESQKLGFAQQELAPVVTQVMELPGVKLCGFMAMAPYGAQESALRRVFSAARKTLDQYRSWGLSELSMGMSDDYQVAIAEGATIVRVGSAIFQ